MWIASKWKCMMDLENIYLVLLLYYQDGNCGIWGWMQEYSNLAHRKKSFEGHANSKEEEGCPKSSVGKLYFQVSNMFIMCSHISWSLFRWQPCTEEALPEVLVVWGSSREDLLARPSALPAAVFSFSSLGDLLRCGQPENLPCYLNTVLFMLG